MADQELRREQDYVTTLYSRLDALLREAEQQLSAVRVLNVGGNHQARTERDSFARLYQERIVQLRDVDDRLAFGRLETAPETPGGAPVYRYIGRVGLRDEALQDNHANTELQQQQLDHAEQILALRKHVLVC